MLQPELLGGKLLPLAARDGNRGCFRRTDDPEIASTHFDLARFHLRVPHFARALGNFSLDEDDGLETQPAGTLDDIGRSPLGIERDLHQPGTIAKVQENNPTEVSDAVYPATEFDFGAGVRGS